MKRFEMITETEARLLEPGSTVELARGGLITPLAQDTLRDLRVTVVHADGRDAAAAAAELIPPADLRTIALASDHSGVALRRALVAYLRGQGLAVQESGPSASTDAVDYPDIAAIVARAVARREVDGGIVIDGAGIGSAVAANKIAGVRAAMCTTPTLARYAREHNGVNVLTLGATLISTDEAIAIVDTWRQTPMTEARYVRRLIKIRALEDSRG